MIYTRAMQESVVHHIAAANSLSVHTPSLSSDYLRSCPMFGEITSRNVKLIQNYDHNQLV